MSHRTKLAWVWIVLLAACGGQDEDLRTRIELTGEPIALEEQVLFISASARKAFLIDATAREPNTRTTELSLPHGALRAVRRVKHDEALVICEGRRASADERAEASTLVAIEAGGGQRRYELGATPFDQLVQSEDGRYAVLYRGPESRGRTLLNVNELVVVDLDAEPDEPGAVTNKTPEGLTHAFTRAVFSPPLPIAGETRRLLLLLSQAEITLFDLNHLDRRGTIVELTGGAARMPQPSQVLFGTDEPTLYVRGDAADDVFVFRLEPRTSDATLNDFRPTINPLGAGKTPRDLKLFRSAEGEQVLVVASAEARLIDPRSGKTQIVTLPMIPDRIRLFEGTSPRDAQTRTRALLYGKEGRTLLFMDLEGQRDRPERNLETLELSDPVTSVIEVGDAEDGSELGRPNTLILTHAQGVTLLDLEQRTATPIAANAPLEGAVFDPQTKRLWVATKSQQWIGTLDLQSGETGELLLDANVQHLLPFFAANRLVVVHPSSIGYVTFVDTREPTREAARSIEGFLLDGILDRGEQ